MKILKNNYNQTKDTIKKSYPRELICDGCESSLEYEESDLRMGEYGCMHLRCPLCGYNNIIDNNENNITLTVDNIEFPLHFHHTSVKTGAVDCFNNETIKKEIYKAIDYFRKNKDVHYWMVRYGNLYIHVYKYEGDKEYSITISNDYYTMEIPFESEDY